MTQQYDNTNRAVLFKNEDKRDERDPDYRGQANADGKESGSMPGFRKRKKTVVSLCRFDSSRNRPRSTREVPRTRQRALWNRPAKLTSTTRSHSDACVLAKTLGGMVPACEVSEKVFRKTSVNELIETDTKTKNTRSVLWHRRYFGLLRLIYQNCERFKSEEDVHFFLKYETGMFDGSVKMESGETVYFVKSIAFSEMTAEEWAAYWKKALDVLYDKVMPGIDMQEALNEIDRCAGLAA